MFIKNILNSFKWIYFMIQFRIYNKWMLNTYDGGMYLKKRLTNLGILGIKIGQYIYTFSHIFIISDEVRDILKDLLSYNNTHPFDYTLDVLLKDNNNYIENIEYIDRNILGSGSIAQVYMCYLKNEPTKRYVLKISHPDLINLENEVKILNRLIQHVMFFIKINVDWQHFYDNILVQTDLRNEGNNIIEYGKIYRNYDKIEIPRLMYCNKYYIVMTYCEGIHLNQVEKYTDQYYMATSILMSSIINSIYNNNICHSDLHPGNIIVKPNGYISLIDFGICNKYNNLQDLLYRHIHLNTYYDMESANIILNYIIVNKPNQIMDYSNILLDIIKNINANNEKYTNSVIFRNLFKLCKEQRLLLSGDVLFIISQLKVLESYADPYYNTSGTIYLNEG